MFVRNTTLTEDDFLHADKHESFLLIDAMIFDGGG